MQPVPEMIFPAGQFVHCPFVTSQLEQLKSQFEHVVDDPPLLHVPLPHSMQPVPEMIFPAGQFVHCPLIGSQLKQSLSSKQSTHSE